MSISHCADFVVSFHQEVSNCVCKFTCIFKILFRSQSFMFCLNGTLEDLLYKLFSLIDVIYFAFIIGGLANIIILTTIPD